MPLTGLIEELAYYLVQENCRKFNESLTKIIERPFL